MKAKQYLNVNALEVGYFVGETADFVHRTDNFHILCDKTVLQTRLVIDLNTNSVDA